jgi:hypothetical protein
MEEQRSHFGLYVHRKFRPSGHRLARAVAPAYDNGLLAQYNYRHDHAPPLKSISLEWQLRTTISVTFLGCWAGECKEPALAHPLEYKLNCIRYARKLNPRNSAINMRLS